MGEMVMVRDDTRKTRQADETQEIRSLRSQGNNKCTTPVIQTNM
jgi:hypothetical protein